MSMRRFIRLVEAPIMNIDFLGGDAPASMRADDIGIVKSPKARDKIKRVLEKAPILINLVFLNHDRAYADPENIGDPDRELKGVGRASGAMSPEVFKHTFGYDLAADENALTAVFAFNEGTDRMPLTPWIIAHRLAHLVEEAYGRGGGGLAPLMVALQRRFGDLGYDDIGMADVQSVIQEIGTTKASRDGKIVNLGEFVAECFAQYLVTGTIRFNPCPAVFDQRVMSDTDRLYPVLGQMIRANPETHIPNPSAVDTMMTAWAKDAIKAFRHELEKLVGKIVVM